MKSLPSIHVIEFAGADTSYRIPLYRACNYWEFLEHLHDTFEKPWELQNAHLHFDNKFCHGRISPSEWNAGAYFAPEFTRGGHLVLYAHFGRVDSRVRAESTDVQASIDEQWHWGWHVDGGSKDKWYGPQEGRDEAMEELKRDPYPRFPERLPLDDPVYETKLDRSESSTGTAILSQGPPQATSTPAKDFIVVDETTNRNLLEHGIVIGHARPQCCRDPRERPTGRAILTQKGNLVAYITAKHSTRELGGSGDVMIPLKDIGYIERFNVFPLGEERRQAILDALPKTTFIKLEEDTPRRSDSTARILSEGVIIGKAKAYCSRDPANPPVVRAVLNSVGSAIAYIEARESKKGIMNGMAQINLKDVDFVEGLQGVSIAKRGKAVRAMILEVKGREDHKGENKNELVVEKKKKKKKKKEVEQIEID